MNPDETPLLAERTMRFYCYEVFRKAAKLAVIPLFRRRLHATA